jgi:hypothetical protein
VTPASRLDGANREPELRLLAAATHCHLIAHFQQLVDGIHPVDKRHALKPADRALGADAPATGMRGALDCGPWRTEEGEALSWCGDDPSPAHANPFPKTMHGGGGASPTPRSRGSTNAPKAVGLNPPQGSTRANRRPSGLLPRPRARLGAPDTLARDDRSALFQSLGERAGGFSLLFTA